MKRGIAREQTPHAQLTLRYMSMAHMQAGKQLYGSMKRKGYIIDACGHIIPNIAKSLHAPSASLQLAVYVRALALLGAHPFAPPVRAH